MDAEVGNGRYTNVSLFLLGSCEAIASTRLSLVLLEPTAAWAFGLLFHHLVCQSLHRFKGDTLSMEERIDGHVSLQESAWL